MCLFLSRSIPDAGTNCHTSLSILSFQDACLYGLSIRLVSDPATTDVCLPVEERLATAGGVMPAMGTGVQLAVATDVRAGRSILKGVTKSKLKFCGVIVRGHL